MSTELAVAATALLVSVLSAIYARRAATEAKNANRISSHQHKLEILEAARTFKDLFRTDGEAVEAPIFYSLLTSADKASLYFTRPVAAHLTKYAQAAHHVLIAREGAKRLEAIDRSVPREKWDEIFRLVDRCQDIEGELLANLESETKIVD